MRIEFVENEPGGEVSTSWLSRAATVGVRELHRQLPGFAPTPLLSLEAEARSCGVGAVLVKDESQRLGLNAFKGLGGVFAVHRAVCEVLGTDSDANALAQLHGERAARVTFVTATDGNHGKGVAWAAGLYGCSAHVLMPKGSAPARVQAIRDAGAEVDVTDLGYDDCVRRAAELAAENGWRLLQDTSWEGYEEVPRQIMQGYTTLLFEAVEQMRAAGFDRPTHVFVQAGVGAMSGSVTGALGQLFGDDMPLVCTVEPAEVACVFESVRRADGQPHPATGSGRTIMAGLNCAEPCSIAWPILHRFIRGAFCCDDGVAREGMRLLAHPAGDDPAIVSGESGAVTAGLLHRLCTDDNLARERALLGLDDRSVVLLVNTEGDTDPEAYRDIVGTGS